MKFYSIISTKELAALLIESKPWGPANTLNLLMREDGSLVALGDDEIELVKEINEDSEC